MINLTISNDEYLNDLMELVRPFETRTSDDLSIDIEYSDEKGGMKIRISSDALCGFVKIMLSTSSQKTNSKEKE